MQRDIFELIHDDEIEQLPLNILVPAKLKRNFIKICKFKGVSMTSAIVKFMELTEHDARVENELYEVDLIDLED